jgi:hypothetical protein
MSKLKGKKKVKKHKPCLVKASTEQRGKVTPVKVKLYYKHFIDDVTHWHGELVHKKAVESGCVDKTTLTVREEYSSSSTVSMLVVSPNPIDVSEETYYLQLAGLNRNVTMIDVDCVQLQELKMLCRLHDHLFPREKFEIEFTEDPQPQVPKVVEPITPLKEYPTIDFIVGTTSNDNEKESE